MSENEFIKAHNLVYEALTHPDPNKRITEKDAMSIQNEIYDRFYADSQELLEKGTQDIIKAKERGDITEKDATELIGELNDKYNPRIEDKRHPDITFASRAGFKAWNTDPVKGLQYLKKRNPGLQWSLDKDGNPIAKKPEERTWSKLDPSSFELEDITDLAYDIPAGMAEAAATAAGGLFGGLPGAMVAGSGAAATTEGLRQTIGKLVGTDETYDEGVLAAATTLGGLSTALLGSGATTKQIAKEAARRGVKESAVKDMQKGLGRRGLEVGARKAGSAAIGIPENILSYVRRSLDNLKAIEADGGKGGTVIRNFKDKIDEKTKQAIRAAGNDLEIASKNPDLMIPVSMAEEPLIRIFNEYKERFIKAAENAPPSAIPELQEAKEFLEVRDALQPLIKGYYQPIAQGQDVANLKRNYRNLAKSRITSLAEPGPVEKDLRSAGKLAGATLDTLIENSGDAGKAYKQASARYNELKDVERNVVNKYFRDNNQTENTLKQLVTNKNVAKQEDIVEGLSKVPVDLDDTALEVTANRMFLDPDQVAEGAGGNVSNQIRQRAPLAGLGGMGGYLLGSQYGEGHGGGVTGAMTGVMLGNYLAQPKTFRKMMEGDKFLSDIWSTVNEASLPKFNVGPQVPNINTGVNIWRQQLQREK